MPTNELHWGVLRRHHHLLILLPLRMWFTDLSPLLRNFPVLQFAIAVLGKYLPKLIQTYRAPFPSLESNINKIQELTGRKLFLGIDWELQSYLTLLLLQAPTLASTPAIAIGWWWEIIWERHSFTRKTEIDVESSSSFVQEQIAMDK